MPVISIQLSAGPLSLLDLAAKVVSVAQGTVKKTGKYSIESSGLPLCPQEISTIPLYLVRLVGITVASMVTVITTESRVGTEPTLGDAFNQLPMVILGSESFPTRLKSSDVEAERLCSQTGILTIVPPSTEVSI